MPPAPGKAWRYNSASSRPTGNGRMAHTPAPGWQPGGRECDTWPLRNATLSLPYHACYAARPVKVGTGAIPGGDRRRPVGRPTRALAGKWVQFPSPPLVQGNANISGAVGVPHIRALCHAADGLPCTINRLEPHSTEGVVGSNADRMPAPEPVTGTCALARILAPRGAK